MIATEKRHLQSLFMTIKWTNLHKSWAVGKKILLYAADNYEASETETEESYAARYYEASTIPRCV